MKVGFILPSTTTGEAGYAKYLKEGLLKRKVQVRQISSPFLKRPNMRIFLGSLMLQRFTNHKDLDLVHNLDNLGPYLFPNHGPVRRVLTVHDIAPVVLPQLHSSLLRFNFKTILPVLIRNSDAVIVPSQATKQDLLHYFSITPEKVEVIPMGIDTSYFYPQKADERVLNKYGINRDYMLYVGTDNPRKNLRNLVISFSHLYQKVDFDLVLVGPINGENLIKFVKHLNPSHELLNRIILPGYVDESDLPVLYSASEAFIFPSLYEGFGFPPLEAMACGTPVIASDNSSISEVVGDAGLLIQDPLNPQEISQSILKLHEDEDLKMKLKEKGLKQVNKFDWDENADKTFQLYQDLL